MTPAAALPPPGHPDAPKYWKDETTGRLAAAIRTYLDNPIAMTGREIALMRAYVSQWIQSPAWDMNPYQGEEGRAQLAELRAAAGAITSARDLQAWITVAAAEGLNPL